MVKRIYLLSLILLVAVAACNTNENTTPTPFPPQGASSPGINLGQIVPLELSELTANPDRYEGMAVMVNGRYKRLPAIVCSTSLYTSPATWNLSSGDVNAYMNGFNSQLRTLLPEEISMTVNGIWRQWNGPVGCGKAATVQKIWFLEVREIISPNPIAQVTLTPTLPGDNEEIADNGQPDPATLTEGTPLSDDELVTAPAPIQPEPTGQQVATPTPILSNNPTATIPAVTPTIDGNGEDSGENENGEEDENEDGTVVPTATTASPGNNTPVPTPTASNNNNNATSTPPSALPTGTPQPNEINIGELSTFQLGFELLNSNEIHVWELDLSANDVITISVAAQSSINVQLSLVDPADGILINAQDNAAAGDIESIYNYTVNMTGVYELHIKTDNGAGGEYVTTIYTNSTFPFIFQDILEYEDTVSGALTEEADDYWHFYGNKGDSVTITVVPDSSTADLFVTLWADSGDLAESDEPDLGATEIINFVLPDNGMYSIQVADWDLLNQGYEISLEEN